MNDSLWPVCLALMAWAAVGILALTVAHLQSSLGRWKTRVAALETGVEMHGSLLVKRQDELGTELKGYREEIRCLAERLRNLEGRMKSTAAWESAMTGAQVDRNIEMDAVRDRIDALSARLDAVELACGVREKPKIMGGAK